jgi:hypothetical protein
VNNSGEAESRFVLTNEYNGLAMRQTLNKIDYLSSLTLECFFTPNIWSLPNVSALDMLAQLKWQQSP